MCVRETEAIIGKAPRLGIHTPKRHAVIRPCGSFSHRNISGTQWNSQKMAKMWILFRSIDSWARSLGGPWTGWIGSAPVQMNGRCLGAALSWLRDGLLWGLAVPHWRFVSPGTVTLVILGLQVLRAHLLGFCCIATFPLIFLQLRKGTLWRCAELLQSHTLCSSDQCGTVQSRLPAVRELFWGMWGKGDGGLRSIGVSGSGYIEVLALEVLNVVWLRRTKETCRAWTCICISSSRICCRAVVPGVLACVHMYILYVCVYICVYVYVRGHVYMYIYMCMCVCICICMRLYTCVYVCVCIFIHRLWVSVSVLQLVDGVMHAHVCSCHSAPVCVCMCV